MANIFVHWFRRDLRVQDNIGLIYAARHADFVIPLFILDDTLLASSRGGRSPRVGFMLDCLKVLHEQLKAHNSGLVIEHGDPVGVLSRVMQEYKATTLTYNHDYTPYATKRDQKVEAHLVNQGYQVEPFKDLVMHDFSEVMLDSDSGRHYQVFTPYKKQWLLLDKMLPQNLDALPPLPDDVETGQLPSLDDLKGVYTENPISKAGEVVALRQLQQFIQDGLSTYDEQRNMLHINGTSLLSPQLRWGTISIRQCYAAAKDAPQSNGQRVWISELVWREFYHMILGHNPYVLKRSYRPKYDAIEWENNRDWFDRWKAGQTGYPVVDAAMRQLLKTGWMHNRARMIVASFLCKDLLIDWRWGEQYFMQHLLDGDSAANNGGWQWTAGTGTDAAPYFRIFNPTSQGKKFDPNGDYIRQWIPELESVPTKWIHDPHGWGNALDYPQPIVDHKVQRQRALELYGVTKENK